MASRSQPPHFVLFPLMGQGHMIPMMDIAKLLAQRGVTVTVVSTPVNSVRFKPVITRAVDSGLQIRFHDLEFPSKEAGLPEGCENFDMLPSLGMAKNIFVAFIILQTQLEQYLEGIKPRPSCLISDTCFLNTTEIARKLGIPRIIFYGPGCFPLLCAHNVVVSQVLEDATSESDHFVVPNLPGRIEFKKSQVDRSTHPDMKGFYQHLEGEKDAYGIVVNSFEELEPDYVKEFHKLKTNKVWCVGPLSLCNKDYLDKAERGNKATIDENQCMEWLDSWEPSSVVYACLGSLCNMLPSQMIELGLGLEASNRPFIWVIRGNNNNSKELKRLISENGFEERTKGRGLVIWGWAPQVLILSHPAIGGFITHCGWNSTLEGVSAGVPMITWPLFADQFYNEKFVVQILGIGVRVGVEVCTQWGKEDEVGVLVGKEDVKKAVDKVLDEGEEGEKRRKKARELGEMAKRAMEEGGSSHLSMGLLIEDILQQASTEESA